MTCDDPLDSSNPRRKQERKRGGEKKGGRIIKSVGNSREMEGRG